MVLAPWFDTDARRTGHHGHTAVQASPTRVAVILLTSSLPVLVLVVCLVKWLKSNLSKREKKKKKVVHVWLDLASN